MIKVGDKFIIEVGAIAELDSGKKKYFIKPFESLVFDRKGLEQLEPYKETTMIDKSNFNQDQYYADLQSAYDNGYNKGFTDAMRKIPLSGELEKQYNRGVEDAWKLAQKVELLTCGEVVEIFGEKALTQFGEDNSPEVFGLINSYSYMDCQEKIKAYEKKKRLRKKTLRRGILFTQK